MTQESAQKLEKSAGENARRIRRPCHLHWPAAAKCRKAGSRLHRTFEAFPQPSTLSRCTQWASSAAVAPPLRALKRTREAARRRRGELAAATDFVFSNCKEVESRRRRLRQLLQVATRRLRRRLCRRGSGAECAAAASLCGRILLLLLLLLHCSMHETARSESLLDATLSYGTESCSILRDSPSRQFWCSSSHLSVRLSLSSSNCSLPKLKSLLTQQAKQTSTKFCDYIFCRFGATTCVKPAQTKTKRRNLDQQPKDNILILASLR